MWRRIGILLLLLFPCLGMECTQLGGCYWSNSFYPTVCKAGTYSTAFSLVAKPSICTLCPPGTYGLTEQQTACTSCESGTYSTSLGKVEKCTSCEVGTYASGVGATTCTACPRGTYQSNIKGSTCVACAANHDNDGTGNYDCQPCTFMGCIKSLPDQHYYNGTTVIPCLQSCPVEGQWMTASCNATAQTVCEDWRKACSSTQCVSGCHLPMGRPCTACPRGTYSVSSTATVCTACPVGSTTTADETRSVGLCQPCPPGKYADVVTVGGVTFARGCLECGEGQYQPAAGQTQCEFCPQNRWHRTKGQVSVEACQVCDEATPIYDRGCKAVPPYHYYNMDNGVALPCSSPIQNFWITSECQNDRDTQFAPCSVECAQGTWLSMACTRDKQAVCQPCRVCDPSTQYTVRECTPVSNTQCAPCNASHWQPGAECNPCPSGSHPSSDGGCMPCPPNTYGTNGWSCENCSDGYVSSGGGTSRCLLAHQTNVRVVETWREPFVIFTAAASLKEDTRLFVMHGKLYYHTTGLYPVFGVVENDIRGVVLFRSNEHKVAIATSGGGLKVYTLYEEGNGWSADDAVEITSPTSAFKGICELLNGTVLLLREADMVRVWLTGTTWHHTSGDITTFFNGSQAQAAGVQPWPCPYDDGLHCFLTWDYAKVYMHDLENTVELMQFNGKRPLGQVVALDGGQAIFWMERSLVGKFYVHRWQQGCSSRDDCTVGFEMPDGTTEGTLFTSLSGGIQATLSNGAAYSSGWKILQPNDCACGPGTFCHDDGQCADAPIGTYAPGYQFGAPPSCAVGYAGHLPGQATMHGGCAKCHEALHTTQAGSVVCVPALMQTLTCPLPQHLIVGLGVCSPCPPGTGHPTPCRLCAEDEYYDTSQCMKCAPYTRTLPGATVCSEAGYSGHHADNHSVSLTLETLQQEQGSIVSLSTSQDSDAALLVAYASGRLMRCVDGYCNSSMMTPQRLVRQSETGVLYGVPLEHDDCILHVPKTGGEVLAGQCGSPGDTDALRGLDASLEPVHDMVLVREMVVVSTLYPGACATLRAVSIDGGPVTTLLHWDVGRMPLYLQQECALTPLLLGAYADQLFVAAGTSVMRLNLSTTTRGALWHYYIVMDASVRVMHVQSYTGFVFVYTWANTSSSRLHNESFPSFNHSLPALGEQIASLGNVLFYVVNNSVATLEVAPERVLCQPGFVWSSDRCLQVPYGYWTSDWSLQSIRPCPVGTRGVRAGAISSEECVRCDDGQYADTEGQTVCQPCPPDTPLSWVDGASCVASCAQAGTRACKRCEAGSKLDERQKCTPCAEGTYSNSSTEYKCVPCPEGWFSPKGAHHCVVVCGGPRALNDKQRGCGDETTCVDVTYDYKMLNSVKLQTGLKAAAVAVYPGASVLYYSDGANVYHLVDKDEACDNTGGGYSLLPSGSSYFGIQALCTLPPKTLYFATKKQVHVISLSYNTLGVLDLDVTRANGVQTVAGVDYSEQLTVTRCLTTSEALSSRFRSISDLEYFEGILYICDWLCNAVHAVNVTSGALWTVVGSGPQNTENREGSTVANCVGDDCARLYQPMGIALSAQVLYIALPFLDWGGIAVVTNSRLKWLCTQRTAQAPTSDTEEQGCLPTQRCALYQARDVLYANLPDPILFVSTTVGITMIELNRAPPPVAGTKCQQLAGTFFGSREADTGDRLGVRDTAACRGVSCTRSSRLHAPVHIALNAQTGVLYVSDSLNSKVRRIYVDGRCRCPLGSTYLEAIHSCYRAHAPVNNMQCAPKHYYSVAAETCVPCGAGDEVQMACIAATPQMVYSFSPQVLQDPELHITKDWFGEASSDGEARPRCIPPCTDVDRYEIRKDWSTVYRPGKRVGERFVSRNWNPLLAAWEPSDMTPVAVLPGLWYPCVGSRCSTDIVYFDQVPGQEARLWDKHRQEVSRQQEVSSFARYMWSKDENIMFYEGCQPSSSFAQTTDQGYCLHAERYRTIVGQVAYVGWPAVYRCMDGYVWVAPAREQHGEVVVTCQTCLPGTYSRREEQHLGGPYLCELCEGGYFSTAVGAHECHPCPVNSYAASGSTACTACPPGQNASTGADGPHHCRDCPPGTGNCTPCAAGEFQDNYGQPHCEACGPGSYSSQSNQSVCTPCAPNYYQDGWGQHSCKRCPPDTHTEGRWGSKHMEACTTCNSTCRLHCAGLACGVNRWLDIGDDWTHSGGACRTCAKGQMSMETCSTTVSSCGGASRAYYFVDENQTIGICADGTQANVGQDGCEACPDGQWSNQTQGCQDRWCDAGHFCVNGTKALCLVGQYASSTGHSRCDACPAGTFTRSVGSTHCTGCGLGEYMGAEGASSGCYLCPSGSFANSTHSTICRQCDIAAKEYSDEGAIRCTKCDHGIFNSDGSTCTPCGLGKYLDPTSQACRFCPIGLVNDKEVKVCNPIVCVCSPIVCHGKKAKGVCVCAGNGFTREL